MTREELIDLVKTISIADGTEDEINIMVELLKQNVPDPHVTNHIFYAELTPEEVVHRH